MKVKATKLGYYNHKRQREGAVFFLKSKEDFSKNWMEEISEEKSKKPRSKKVVKPEAKAADLNQDVI